MNIEEIFDDIAGKAIEIDCRWRDDNISSKAIRKEIEHNFFQNDKADFIVRFAYFYALEKRIKARYGNILKRLFRYFQWKKETALLFKIKRFLRCPEYFDAQSIILQKIEDKLNGEDCFESDNTNKNGLKLQNKTDKTLDKKGKEEQNPEESLKNSNADPIDKARQTESEYGFFEKENDGDEVSLSPEFYDVNRDDPIRPKDSTDNTVSCDAASVKRNDEVREHIEISKDDLIKFDSRKVINDKSAVKNNAVKAEVKPLPKQSVAQVKSNESIKTECDFVDNAKRIETNSTEQATRYVADINVDAVKVSNAKAQDNLNVYFDKYPQTKDIGDYNTYERQKSEIAGEEISKISEEDMQAIKDIMQEEINKQMSIAEERGEIYEMPLGIKEALAQPIAEKSEVQTNKTNDTILNKK